MADPIRALQVVDQHLVVMGTYTCTTFEEARELHTYVAPDQISCMEVRTM